ncbi:fluoroquinolone transport system permease protein [Spirosomataceae bacterium TFI 002]|nr:fluoroquinolone transport system permease protein [Spirosomataceae bacterium TFI 002]
MKQFWHLFKFDFMLLAKYKVLSIALAVSAVYIAVFRFLPAFEGKDKLIVLLIFNDPALLGILFVGVMVLFEKNENTLVTLAVSPMKLKNYILSKGLIFSLLSLFCCLAMVIFGYGEKVNFIHFSLACFLGSFIFSMLGFIAVANQNSFNKYILRAVWIILLIAVPFLAYFGLVSQNWFWLFPSQPLIFLFDHSFNLSMSTSELVLNYLITFGWCIVSYIIAKRNFSKSLCE